MQIRPLVYIIGAGPGDPGLITMRGLQCLGAADVVLHDHLVSPRLLRHASADAERIDVGGASPQAMAQEAICYLLAEKAREGRVVARLKWGDPFIFDRGAEEALFLHEHGVPVRSRPGDRGRTRRSQLCRGAGDVPGCGRHADIGAGTRGRAPDGA